MRISIVVVGRFLFNLAWSTLWRQNVAVKIDTHLFIYLFIYFLLTCLLSLFISVSKEKWFKLVIYV